MTTHSDDAIVEAMACSMCRTIARDDTNWRMWMDAARAALAVVRERQGWRTDMESAPKDGAKVLIWMPDGTCGVAVFDGWDWIDPNDETREDGSTEFIYDPRPTHWKPIAPPEGER